MKTQEEMIAKLKQNLKAIPYNSNQTTLKTLIETCYLLVDRVAELESTIQNLVKDKLEIDFIPFEKAFSDYSPSSALRGARQKESLTQKELARQIGVSRHYISEMENNKRSIGRELAKKLSKVLNIDYKIFL